MPAEHSHALLALYVALIPGAAATGSALILRQLRLWSRQRQDYKLRRHIFDQTRSLKVLEGTPEAPRRPPQAPREVGEDNAA